ncbi:potassium transporter [Frateuria sp. Soil773]|uniref:voltage-gated potassium channel protein n=1 Tax=Frateuria sp. Soil773 TaxID=1736407 RepID=UPI0006FBC5A0|nr:voltage-gated potassium channel protein [Frateuria sp. Soil773]KRE89016.1 potassium transporter [Frateuria sp. Soil773]
MQLPHFKRLREASSRLQRVMHARLWFPQVPLALLIAMGGALLLDSDHGLNWRVLLPAMLSGRMDLDLALLPRLLIGVGMLTMALGLVFRSRMAWAMALLLSLTAIASLVFSARHAGQGLAVYYALVLVALLAAGRRFDRSSMAAGTLFALTSMVMLLLYATYGSYYLGDQFTPRIEDLATALYFAIVTTSTVGYGDITPHTTEARLFSISLITLGITVFATSLTAVIGPLVSRSLKGIVDKKLKQMDRKNHFIVVGDTPLADNTWRELMRRGQPVTRIFNEATKPSGGTGEDVVIGDPGNADVLRQAGSDKARTVLAMLADDSDNAFVVLAVREVNPATQTVVAVNDARHLERIRLVRPDLMIAPQVLGGELAAKILCGEEVSADFVMKSVLHRASMEPGSNRRG